MQKNLVFVGAISVLLSGCMGSLVSTQNSCSSSNSTYLSMWDCIKKSVTNGTAGLMNNAEGIRYMATGDALADRVKRGVLTDAEAKAALANELARSENDFERKKALYSPIVCNKIGYSVICN